MLRLRRLDGGQEGGEPQKERKSPALHSGASLDDNTFGNVRVSTASAIGAGP